MSSGRCSAPAAWARSIARATRSSGATSRSRSCRRRSPPIRIGWPASSARRGCSPRSIIRTSRAIYGIEESTASARARPRARRGPDARAIGIARPGRFQLDEALASRGRSPTRSTPRTRRHRPSRSEAGQHQAHARRPRQGARLRPREESAADDGADAHAFADDHDRATREGVILGTAGLHEPGAGARPAGRQAHRHLGVRLRAVRDADRPRGVCGRHDDRHDRRDPRARAGVGRAAVQRRRRRSSGCSIAASRKISTAGSATSPTCAHRPRRHGTDAPRDPSKARWIAAASAALLAGAQSPHAASSAEGAGTDREETPSSSPISQIRQATRSSTARCARGWPCN